MKENRMKPNFKLKELVYFCSKMDEMLHFYSEILGMEHLNADIESHKGNWVELGNNTFKLCLHGAGESGCPSENKNKLTFFTENIEEAKAFLRNNGIPTCDIVIWSSKNVIEGFDPEGNRFQIAAPVKQDLVQSHETYPPENNK